VPRIQPSLDPYARLDPPNPLRWFSSGEIDLATDSVSLLPLFYEQRDVAMEIGRVLDEALANAWCVEHLRDPEAAERTISVYPILSVEIEARGGVGLVRVLDLEVLPNILPSLARACIWDALDGRSFEAEHGPYAHRLKHVAQYYGFFSELDDDRWAVEER
jgi:hypothetical protein